MTKAPLHRNDILRIKGASLLSVFIVLNKNNLDKGLEWEMLIISCEIRKNGHYHRKSTNVVEIEKKYY